MLAPDQLKAIRKRAGWTQCEAAAVTIYSLPHYRRWEQGRATMPPEAAERLLLAAHHVVQRRDVLLACTRCLLTIPTLARTA